MASRSASRIAGSVVELKKLLHLLVDGVGDLPPAIADIHAPQPGQTVEQLSPFGIVQPASFAGGDNVRAAGSFHVRMMRERVQVMLAVDPAQLG